MRLQHYSSVDGRHKRLSPQFFLGAALALGLTATAFTPAAEAATIRLGTVDVQIDTTVSAGVSVLMSEREEQFLPVSNGGPDVNQVFIQPNGDGSPNIGAGPTASTNDFATCATVAGNAYGQFCQDLPHTLAGTRPNFDGSINTDDGRLNFDDGDLVSAPFKITSEIEAQAGAWTGFARVSAFYDGVLMDDGAFERGGLSDKGRSRAGQNLYLLDAYVDYDGDIGDMPFTLRAGRQVINWGEATFIPGGNSAFSPIDVAAIRRPGAEIKEALLPVEALYGSIALTQDITLEAYIGGWDDFRLDAGGTLFGGSDVFTPGTENGNPHNVYFIGGGTRSGQQFACDTAGLTDAGLTASATIAAAVLATGAVDCEDNPNMDVLRDWTEGAAEQERHVADDTNIVRGLDNGEGDDSFGLAFRWYAENLNSTEFAFYYQEVDSRLPYISYRTGRPGVTASSTGYRSSTVGRGAGATGCNLLRANTAQAVAGGLLYDPAYATTAVNDEYDLLGNATIQAVANGVANSLNGLVGYIRSATPGNNIAYLQETICLLTIGQTDGTRTLGSSTDGFGQLPTGATNLQLDYDIGLFAEYPQVEIIGFSFNTTVLGWGVQGDFTHRPEMPLQIDTDVLTIASLFHNCAFTTVAALEGVYLSGSTYNNEFGNIGCNDRNRNHEDNYLQGYTTAHDASTWDIGTTATFTRSNPVVSFFGADLGILLTEFQGVIAEDIEEERGNTGGLIDPNTGTYPNGRGISPLTNVCQGGSDLPLNGILSIDDRGIDNPKGFCRPTDSSWGAVLFAQLQYNNAFGSAWNVNPTLIWSEGIEGYSPSPLGFWREGVGATSIRVDANYLNAWQFSLAYTDYTGDIERTRNLDRNTLSLSASYAF